MQRSTSTVKSTWPGVSMMLMLCWSRRGVVLPPSGVFQMQAVAALTMVMPRSCSWGIQSVVAVPSSTLPMRCRRPV